MGRRIVLYCILLVCAASLGCDLVEPRTSPISSPVKQPYQRFLPIQAENQMMQGVPWHGYFALDTKTGSLCSTMKGRIFKGEADWVNDVPNCGDLLAANPD